MTDQLSKDVEQLKAHVDDMRSGQGEIKESIKDIAHALKDLVEIRKDNEAMLRRMEAHDVEIGRLRDKSHKISNMVQAHEILIPAHAKSLEKIADMETSIRIQMARNSVIAGFGSAIITSALVLFLKG